MRDSLTNTNTRKKKNDQGGHELVSRLRSSQCETASPHACQPMGTQVPSSSASSGRHVAGGAPLSSGVMRVPLNLTHTATCNMSRGQLLVPLDPDAEFAALSFEQAQAGLATRGVAVGRWVVFVGGACTGRWAQIATLDVSRRCLDLVSVWPDALPACVPSPAEAAAAGDVAYVVGSAPWARLALPPLDCLSCTQVRVCVCAPCIRMYVVCRYTEVYIYGAHVNAPAPTLIPTLTRTTTAACAHRGAAT